ncbi:hypothetical protein E3N88_12569 [Mikania micrantha]|uniref:UBC core domain-containing protein n=1 Tax=Mikania micrantha TaxID=192012 RepID=A0A5N6P631_9ASTR|nr:hypothetical protein E3N88_12569 [Mikania micrantha]
MGMEKMTDGMTAPDVGVWPNMSYFKAKETTGFPKITYLHLYDCDKFSIGIFLLPPSGVLPLHNHPQMTVFSKLLFGTMHIKAYDWVVDDGASISTPKANSSKGEVGPVSARLAKLKVNSAFTAPCNTSILYPEDGGNMHCFTAITPCAVLDVLGPPYCDPEGRHCQYYRTHPFTYFSGDDKNLPDDEKTEDYAWLEEIDKPASLSVIADVMSVVVASTTVLAVLLVVVMVFNGVDGNRQLTYDALSSSSICDRELNFGVDHHLLVNYRLHLSLRQQLAKMSTPSRKRLMRDFKRLQQDPPAGISGAPCDNNIMLWNAVIFGPDDTPWDGGTFKLTLQFSEDYPNKPPTVRFISRMFHPNIYADGSICLDILQNQWSPIYDVAAILTSIQSLLCDPNPNSPANSEAARLFSENKREYNRKVREVVEQSWTAD